MAASLPLQGAVPLAGSTIIPPALQTALTASTSTSSLLSSPTASSSAATTTTAAASVPAASTPGVNVGQSTRILLLSEFSKELKTRDLQRAFEEFQDLNGGFRIKWRDDSSAWIVFEHAATAKRAYLRFLFQPPPEFTVATDTDTDADAGDATTSTHSGKAVAKLVPYNGSDAAQILSAVQNRARSRSIHHQQQQQQPQNGVGSGTSQQQQQQLGHQRRPSSSSTQPAPPGQGQGSSAAQGHARTPSFQSGHQRHGSRGGQRGASWTQKQWRDVTESNPSTTSTNTSTVHE